MSDRTLMLAKVISVLFTLAALMISFAALWVCRQNVRRLRRMHDEEKRSRPRPPGAKR